MGNNFLGLEEISPLKERLGLSIPSHWVASAPPIHFTDTVLKEHSESHVLVIGIPWALDGSPLTINAMRTHFGTDPSAAEPCFYHQDWYLRERFAAVNSFDAKWYLIRKEVLEKFRGREPTYDNQFHGLKLPSAVLCAYVFFVYYLVRSERLWDLDYIWCSDTDENGDQIYVGRYSDSNGINKNGFNIHRHLRIRSHYSAIDLVT